MEAVFAASCPKCRQPVEDSEEGGTLARGELDGRFAVLDEDGVEVAGEGGEHVFWCSVEEGVGGGGIGTVIDVDDFGSASRQSEVKEGVEKNSLSLINTVRASRRCLGR